MKKFAMGSIVALLFCNSLTYADRVFNTDIIIDGSQCIGTDCVDNETFGLDTLKLKENNLRIKFEDSSTSTLFPSNDWQITINDSNSGGQNKFSIDDISSGLTPFTLEAGVPDHSLYIDDNGNVGFGTSTPAVENHLLDGDTPAVRLEQTDASGWTPQVWDIAGNDVNFFVRDATNKSSLPFRIRPGAPTSSIDIATNGNVGIGTTSPDARIHIKDEGTSVIAMETSNGEHRWDIIVDSVGTLKISKKGASRSEFIIDESGRAIFRGDVSIEGDLSVQGTCTGC